ncbi:MAG: hypothetical protein IT326_02010 [Anaerolineae bacterium]|nr:hypothetical protein [Anaerolineae bacterium]
MSLRPVSQFHRRALRATALGLLILSIILPGIALAQDDDGGLPEPTPTAQPSSESFRSATQTFVYTTTYFDGMQYGAGTVPPVSDTIYLLAGQENIIAPRKTYIFYWPLTNEYLADFRRLNELVEGSLEVLQNGQLVQTVELEPFVTKSDSDDPVNTLELYRGDEAIAAYAAWQATQSQYQRDLLEYSRLDDEWRAEMMDLIKQYGMGGVPDEVVPPQPVNPSPPTIKVTEPTDGFILDLAPGTYQIRVVLPDGSVQPNSEKRLVVFSARREAIAYKLIPASRWTVPLQSDNPISVIYVQPDTTIYLQPYESSEYNERSYGRMINPQNEAARADRWTWKSEGPNFSRTLRMIDGRTVTDIPLTSYKVEQRIGSRGYDIVVFDPAIHDASSFGGFEVKMRPGVRYTVYLVDDEGEVVPGSEREIRALATNQSGPLYAMSLLPIVVGVAVLVFRQKSIRQIKLEDISQ